MKNPNSFLERLKRNLKARWSDEDYPGADPCFQLQLLAKDLGIFVVLPLLAVFIYRSATLDRVPQRKFPKYSNQNTQSGSPTSQIIEFGGSTGSKGGVSAGFAYGKKSPGSLVRVRLLNVVETYSTAPVHVQIVDRGLGERLMGGTLIGDATPDPNFERINISFRFARDPNRDSMAAQISARALSLDGTLGLEAKKKEGFVTRSAIGSAYNSSQSIKGSETNADFKEILFRALTSGLIQEFGSSAQVERNRSQVLSLSPSTEFFAELTDFFPGSAK
ncbi:hypothetical protein GW916_11510 [bacterium]|nr:hypothetical protein [bacterium]